MIIIFLFLIIKEFKKINFIKYLFYGLTAFIATCLLVIFINDIPFKNIFIQYILYPIHLGQERSINLNIDFKNFILQFKFIYFSLITLAIPSFILIKQKRKQSKNLIDILILITFLFSILIFIYSQLMTKNQILIFFLIPFCIGISHYYFDNYYNSKKIIYLFIFIIFISTLKFHIRFNIDKKFMELSKVDFSLVEDGKFLHSKLTGLNWITPIYPENPKRELLLLKDTLVKIRNEKKNKIIITDYQILPSITETTNFAPNKWFDDLSVPEKNVNTMKFIKDF